MKKLSFLLLCGFFFAATLQAQTVASGTTGTLTWEIAGTAGNYILTISGTGAMPDYGSGGAPWYSYRADITAVNIGANVTAIGNYAFSDCTGLTEVTIGSSVISIGNAAFWYCTELTSVTIPDGVTSIGNSAFSACSRLTGVIIPDGVTSIDDYAFSGCRGLTEVTIGERVTSIGNYAFWGCSGLISITIPDGVTSIGYEAFSNCTGLTRVTIGDGVTSIDALAFFACKALTAIAVSAGNTNYSSEEYVLFNKDKTTLVLYPEGKKGEYIIPQGVTSISDRAFWNCTGLTSVTIPDGVTSIDYGAFANCTGLTGVIIPDGVTFIGDNVFYGCTGLTEITIGESVTSIGNEAFYNCTKLISVTISDGVISIGDRAFLSCTGLTEVIIGESVTSIGERAFYNCTALTSIEVAAGNTDYSSADDILFNKDKTALMLFPPARKQGTSSYIIPDGVTSIGYAAFSNCTGLTSITIPAGVTSIGNYAFGGCSNLAEINNHAGTPQTIDNLVYQGVNTSTCILRTLVTSVFRYSAANVWQNFTNKRVFFIDYGTLLVIDSDATMSALGVNTSGWQTWVSNFTSVEIKNSVTSIPAGLLSSFRNLEELTIPYVGITATSSGRDATLGRLFGVDTPLVTECEDFENGSVTTLDHWIFVNGNQSNQWNIGTATSYEGNRSCYITNDSNPTLESPNWYSTYLTGVAHFYRDFHVISTAGDPAKISFRWKCQGNSYDDLRVYVVETSVTPVAGSLLSATPLAVLIYGGASTWNLQEITLPVMTGTSRLVFTWRNGNYVSSGTQAPAIDNITFPSIDNNYQTVQQYYSPTEHASYYIPSSLKKVTVAGGSQIGYGAFQGLSMLEEVSIAASVDMVSERAFLGCSNLKRIYARRENPPIAYNISTFEGINKFDCVLYVSAGSKSKYSVADGWKEFFIYVDNIIEEVVITGVSLNKTAISLGVGGTERLIATVEPANAPNQVVTWSSDNPAVATVSNDGTVMAKSEGAAVITVTTQEGGKTATCTVTVTASQAGNVAVSGTVAGAPSGTEVQLYCAEDGTVKSGVPSGYTYVASTTTNGAGYYCFDHLPPGVYIVIVVMEGYESTATNPMTLADGETADNINFTVKGDTVTPDGGDITGTGEMFAPDLKIYPNPFTGEVRIVGAVVETLRATSLQMRVINAAGAVVHTQMITNPDETIRLEHLPAGVYFFVIENGKQAKTVKVVKE